MFGSLQVSEPSSFQFLAILLGMVPSLGLGLKLDQSLTVHSLNSETSLLQHILQAGQVWVEGFVAELVSQSYHWDPCLATEDGRTLFYVFGKNEK